MRGRPLGAIFLGLPSRISMDDSPAIPRKSLDFHGWFTKILLGNPRIFMDFPPNSLGNPRISMDFSPIFLGNPRISMDDSPGIPREILGFSWMVHQNSLGNPWIFMDFSPKFYWEILGFPWIFPQIPGKP